MISLAPFPVFAVVRAGVSAGSKPCTKTTSVAASHGLWTPAKTLFWNVRSSPGSLRHAEKTIRVRVNGSRLIQAVASSSGVRSVPVQVAHELLEAGHRYIDVRTPEEFAAGHVEGAVNVPYMFKKGGGMAKNPRFLEEMEEGFDKDSELVIGCQSGKRSMMACVELIHSDFTAITDVGGGFSAWAASGLPVET